MIRISTWAAILLVVLRLVIGWHFFVEGFLKVKSRWVGPSEISKPFSSEGYFREATGPFGPYVRLMVANPDAIVESFKEIQVPAKGVALPVGVKAPGKVHEEWTELVNRYDNHFRLSPDQKAAAEKKVAESETDLIKWLLERHEFKTTYPSGAVEKTMTVPERVDEYFAAKAKIEDVAQVNFSMGKEVEKAKWVLARANANAMRADLLSEYNQKTAALKSALDGLLTDEQKASGSLPPKMDMLYWSDLATSYCLLFAGMGMLAGCLTRWACLGAALFLGFTYALQPSFPWLPSPPQNEGNYIYVNKNVIEMMALLVLAALPTGNWFGVDSLIGWALGWDKRPQESRVS